MAVTADILNKLFNTADDYSKTQYSYKPSTAASALNAVLGAGLGYLNSYNNYGSVAQNLLNAGLTGISNYGESSDYANRYKSFDAFRNNLAQRYPDLADSIKSATTYDSIQNLIKGDVDYINALRPLAEKGTFNQFQKTRGFNNNPVPSATPEVPVNNKNPRVFNSEFTYNGNVYKDGNTTPVNQISGGVDAQNYDNGLSAVLMLYNPNMWTDATSKGAEYNPAYNPSARNQQANAVETETMLPGKQTLQAIDIKYKPSEYKANINRTNASANYQTVMAGEAPKRTQIMGQNANNYRQMNTAAQQIQSRINGLSSELNNLRDPKKLKNFEKIVGGKDAAQYMIQQKYNELQTLNNNLNQVMQQTTGMNFGGNPIMNNDFSEFQQDFNK